MGNAVIRFTKKQKVEENVSSEFIFEYWNQLLPDIQKLVIVHLNYIELIESRTVSQSWKALIDHRLSTMPSSHILKDIVEIRYFPQSPGVTGYTGYMATEYLKEYGRIKIAQSEEEYQILKHHNFEQWERPYMTTFALRSRKFNQIFKLDDQDISQNSEILGIYENNMYRLLLKIQYQFREKFIHERVALFNRLHNLNINPECFPFKLIDSIHVRNDNRTKRLYCCFDTLADRIENELCGSEYYEQEECTDSETGDVTWKLLDPTWKDQDTEEVVTDWDNYVNHCTNHKNEMTDWLISKSKDVMELREIINENPVDYLKKGGIHGRTAYFMMECPGLIFGYILYKTQQFLGKLQQSDNTNVTLVTLVITLNLQFFIDSHEIHWKDFSYAVNEIDKLSIPGDRKTLVLENPMFYQYCRLKDSYIVYRGGILSP